MLGLALISNIFYQQSKISLTVKLATENSSTTDCIGSVSEINEDDQATHKFEIVTTVDKTNQPDQIQITCRLFQPTRIVWQPPKIG